MLDISPLEYAKNLREAADFYDEKYPQFQDVVSTYRRSAEIIEELYWRTQDE